MVSVTSRWPDEPVALVALRRPWSRAEFEQKYRKLCPEKVELIEGRMFWSDEQRLNMLGLLLENVGMDATVSLGDTALWKQALAERLKAQEGDGPEGVEEVGPEDQ